METESKQAESRPEGRQVLSQVNKRRFQEGWQINDESDDAKERFGERKRGDSKPLPKNWRLGKKKKRKQLLTAKLFLYFR